MLCEQCCCPKLQTDTLHFCHLQRWRESVRDRTEARQLYALAFEQQYLSIVRRALWALAEAVHRRKVIYKSTDEAKI